MRLSRLLALLLGIPILGWPAIAQATAFSSTYALVQSTVAQTEASPDEEAAPPQQAVQSEEQGAGSPPPVEQEARQEEEQLDPTDVDSIFRSVFGRERPELGSDEFIVQVNGINSGTYVMEPPSLDGQGGWIEKAFADRILLSVLVPELHDRTRSLAADDRITFSELREMGIEVRFDRRRLALFVDIPSGLRTRQTINVRALAREAQITYVPQAFTSGYLNVRAGVDIVEDSVRQETGIDRLAVEFDGAIRVGSFVLEGGIDFDDRRTDNRWRREDILLSYDDRSTLMRYELGDLSIGRRPFQGTPRIAGVAAFKDFSINPYLNIRPTPGQVFELEQGARVEVVLNGIPIRTLELSPGRYRLRDFPLVPSAANDIRLRLTYASGRVEELLFPAFFDFELLADGLQDFGLNVGVPYTTSGGERDYDTDNFNILGYYRVGVSDTLTAGVNVEADEDFANLGAETIWASPIGTFALNVAGDVTNFGADNAQAVLQYRWRDTDRERDRTVDALLQVTGRDFRTLNQLFGENLIKVQARVRAGQAIGPVVRAQVFGSYESYHQTLPDSYSVGASLTGALGRIQLGGSLEYRSSQGFDEVVGQFQVAIRFGRTAVTGSYETQDNAIAAQFSKIEPFAIGAINAGGRFERSDRRDRQSLRFGYIDNRFEAGVQQFATNYLTPGEDAELVTEFRAASSIVMADGRFAISRPVTNSFAIFGTGPGTEFDVAIDPQTSLGGVSTAYLAESGALGPGVVNNITPYFNRRVRVETKNADPSIRLDQTVFAFNSDYRAGYYVGIDADGSAALVGNLVDQDGDPIGLTSGRYVIVGAEAGNEGDRVFFTNRAGRFYIDGLEPGQSLTLSIDGFDGAEVTIAVPDDAEGLVTFDQPVSFPIDVPAP